MAEQEVPPPAVVGADGAAPAAGHAERAAAARQSREHDLQAMRQRRAELRGEQKRLAKDLRLEQQRHSRAVKRMRTLPTGAILQHLRERGEAV
jgi:hypothetical protein